MGWTKETTICVALTTSAEEQSVHAIYLMGLRASPPTLKPPLPDAAMLHHASRAARHQYPRLVSMDMSMSPHFRRELRC
ncbi:hypothetical protein CGRA01v4_13314 [Colletotrichum graminicola]|nr:hypothetical protein CGRA01v4_13314 [Colletotrichum graminicola]